MCSKRILSNFEHFFVLLWHRYMLGCILVCWIVLCLYLPLLDLLTLISLLCLLCYFDVFLMQLSRPHRQMLLYFCLLWFFELDCLISGKGSGLDQSMLEQKENLVKGIDQHFHILVWYIKLLLNKWKRYSIIYFNL